MYSIYKETNKTLLAQSYKKKYNSCKLNKKQKEEFESAEIKLSIAPLIDGIKNFFIEDYDQTFVDKTTLKYYYKGIKVWKKIYGKNDISLISPYREMTEKFIKNKNYDKAYNNATKMFQIYLNNMEFHFETMNAKQKKQFLANNMEIIKVYLKASYLYSEIKTSSKLNKYIIQKVLTLWLNYKGSIFDSENAIATLYLNTKDKNLEADIEKLMNYKRELAKLYQSIPKPKQREAWQKNIKELEASIDSLTKKIANKANSFKELQALKNISYKDISKNLKDKQAYIDFAKAGEYYYIFTLDNKENVNFIRIDKESSKKIDSLVKSFRKDIGILLNESLDNKELAHLTKSSKEKLAKLYSAIFTPLKDIIKDKQSLIISPDGALKLIPFEAMYNKNSNKYLIEEKNIKYIPSGKELVRLYKFNNTKLAKNETVIFDNPDFKDKSAKNKKIDTITTLNTNRAGIVKSLFKLKFDKLPGTKAEAKAIKETLKNKIKIVEFSEKEANEDNLLKVKEPKILHIATHGFFINDKTIPNPMLKSGIALSGANNGAKFRTGYGIVTALKLSGLKLKGTDLVVLSACETGVVDINSTESVSALGKAFIQAGAKDIIISLWTVDDNATKELMSSFYKKMLHTKSYSKALKEAKLEMIKQNMHPFYWAPFVVSGL